MKRLAFAALAALACSAITLSAQAAPISGVGKLAAASPESSLVDHVRWCHRHYWFSTRRSEGCRRNKGLAKA
jgi:hypothetical protein